MEDLVRTTKGKPIKNPFVPSHRNLKCTSQLFVSEAGSSSQMRIPANSIPGLYDMSLDKVMLQ